MINGMDIVGQLRPRNPEQDVILLPADMILSITMKKNDAAERSATARLPRPSCSRLFPCHSRGSPFLGVIGLAIMVSGETTGQSGSLLWSLGWSSLLSALLIFPAAIQGWFRLLHRNPPVWQAKHPFLIASLGLLLWPLFLWLANHISGQSTAGLALPLVRIMIILLPIWWFFEIGAGRSRPHLPNEMAVAGISLTITPLIIISLEPLFSFWRLDLCSAC